MGAEEDARRRCPLRGMERGKWEVGGKLAFVCRARPDFINVRFHRESLRQSNLARWVALHGTKYITPRRRLLTASRSASAPQHMVARKSLLSSAALGDGRHRRGRRWCRRIGRAAQPAAGWPRDRHLSRYCFILTLVSVSVAAMMLLYVAWPVAAAEWTRVTLFKAIDDKTEVNFPRRSRYRDADVNHRSPTGLTVLMRMSWYHDWRDAAASSSIAAAT